MARGWARSCLKFLSWIWVSFCEIEAYVVQRRQVDRQTVTLVCGGYNGTCRMCGRYDDCLHCHAKWISNYTHIFLFARGLTSKKNDLRNRNDFRFDFSLHFGLALPLHRYRNSHIGYAQKLEIISATDARHTHTPKRNSIIHSVSDNFWRSNLIGCHTIFVFICFATKVLKQVR